MRLLLTGATGFLGRHVAAAAQGWTLFRTTRAPEATTAGEIALGPAPWTRESFCQALEVAQPDAVLHCAGAPHTTDPLACFAANTVLAADLLAAVSRHANPPRVILIGSAAEYGFVPQGKQPVSETQPCAPRSDYAVAKHAQTLLGLAAHMAGRPVLTARLFNAVGTGMPAPLALPSFARRIVGAAPGGTIVAGDLSARRDFIDATEAARLLLALAALPAWPWPIVNICSGTATSLQDLMDRMIALNGRSLRVQSDPSLIRPGDMAVLTGCTSRLAEIGLAPNKPDFATLLPKLLAEAKS